MDVMISAIAEERTVTKVRDLVHSFSDNHVTVNYDEAHIGKNIRGLGNHPTLLLLVDLGVDYEFDLSSLPTDKSYIVYDDEVGQNINDVGCYVEKDRLVNLFYGLPGKFTGIVYLKDNELRAFKYMCEQIRYSRRFVWECLAELCDNPDCSIYAVPLSSLKQKENSLCIITKKERINYD